MVRSNKNALCLWGIRSPVFAAYLAGEPRGRTPFGFSDMLPARSRWQSVTFRRSVRSISAGVYSLRLPGPDEQFDCFGVRDRPARRDSALVGNIEFRKAAQ